ncbi:MAG: hypothetical protein CVU65_00445 [Deltaproteobacteria bacterium HGW-Deltaproteobacteria-22]|nr:MAG: hypothetical protein CVU65_00445 [Deltaproteobacteria bacterium HGW-Deltaproteobacteria-22]
MTTFTIAANSRRRNRSSFFTNCQHPQFEPCTRRNHPVMCGRSIVLSEGTRMTTSRVDPLIGTRLGERMTLIQEIGRGGMGTVYRARHEILERDFAVKILRSDMRRDPVVVERFKREARAASRLEHPNVVFISDFDQLPDRRFYIVMEFISGKSLRDLLNTEGPMAVNRVCQILTQIADALDYAHEQGVIHRDLKSENIILTNSRGREVAKILDFGLAKLVSDAVDMQSITNQGQIFGTPETMAPEQITGGPIDNRVDIYAMGVLTYELLVGKPPFSGHMLQVLMAHKKQAPPKPSADRKDVPPELDDLVLKCMAKEPSGRYSRASELVTVYQNILQQSAVVANRKTSPPMAPLRQGVSSVRMEAALDEKGVLELRLHESVLEVAEHLRDRNLGSARITQVLATILEQEEKLVDLRNQKHLLQTQLDSIEVSGRERAARLRHAIISLTLETKGKMESGEAPAKLAEDVRYQIVELERRLSEVITDQERSEKELEKQLARLVQELQSIEHEIRKNQDALFELIQSARGSIGNSSTLRNAFGQIDELRQKMARFPS